MYGRLAECQNLASPHFEIPMFRTVVKTTREKHKHAECKNKLLILLGYVVIPHNHTLANANSTPVKLRLPPSILV
jgi:hypothetical protein